MGSPWRLHLPNKEGEYFLKGMASPAIQTVQLFESSEGMALGRKTEDADCPAYRLQIYIPPSSRLRHQSSKLKRGQNREGGSCLCKRERRGSLSFSRNQKDDERKRPHLRSPPPKRREASLSVPSRPPLSPLLSSPHLLDVLFFGSSSSDAHFPVAEMSGYPPPQPSLLLGTCICVGGTRCSRSRKKGKEKERETSYSLFEPAVKLSPLPCGVASSSLSHQSCTTLSLSGGMLEGNRPPPPPPPGVKLRGSKKKDLPFFSYSHQKGGAERLSPAFLWKGKGCERRRRGYPSTLFFLRGPSLSSMSILFRRRLHIFCRPPVVVSRTRGSSSSSGDPE